MSKILVTGGAGFIGSHVADSFISLGHDVIILDDLSTGFRENVNPKAKFYQMDIRSPEVENLFEKEKFDILCHHAAQVDLRKSMREPVQDAEINILGSLKLIFYCLKYEVKEIIFPSSAGVYGEQDYFPADETHPKRPVSPYAMAKLVVEKYLEFYRRSKELEYVTLRYSNVYGPRQIPKGEAGVVGIFCENLLNHKEAKIYGDGKQTRDFVFIDDVVKANVLALDYNKSGVFNIGTSIETDINMIFNLIKDNLGSNQEEIHAPAVPGEQKRSALDITEAKKELGWEPECVLEKGIEKTIKFYKKRYNL
ncbi:MAG: NAD-dependent epimerase/dehydratase family protein [Candidatus Zixiibacteriota bacterium]